VNFDAKSTLTKLYAVQKFKCPTFIKNYPRSTSVHKLRPTDIEVIGAMGDSITSANGAKATNMSDVRKEYRGIAWSIGSENPDINELITLPSKYLNLCLTPVH
jgi:hypothetical protein